MPPKSKRSLQLGVARAHRQKKCKTQECSSKSNEGISEDKTSSIIEEHITDPALEFSSTLNSSDMSENETTEVSTVSTESVVPATGDHSETAEEIVPTFSDYDSQDDEDYTSPAETATARG